MKTFRHYLSERETAAPNDPLIPSAGLGSMSSESGGDDCLMRIARMVIDDHRTEVLSFFQHLSARDGRIEEELKNYHVARKHGKHPKKDGNLPKSFDTSDKDEIVPSSADSQGGLEGQED